mmetsp:Transcript_6319/g.9587  ORF Transcript_6319/g.9587 Transcript_6319/m.9587 type:complete len:447 (-) Transcript_6319:81-1421(-)
MLELAIHFGYDCTFFDACHSRTLEFNKGRHVALVGVSRAGNRLWIGWAAVNSESAADFNLCFDIWSQLKHPDDAHLPVQQQRSYLKDWMNRPGHKIWTDGFEGFKTVLNRFCPAANHLRCTLHLHRSSQKENGKTIHKYPRGLLMDAQSAPTKELCDERLKNIKSNFPKASENLEKVERSFYCKYIYAEKGIPTYGHKTTNLVETLFKDLDIVRGLPPFSAIDAVLEAMMRILNNMHVCAKSRLDAGHVVTEWAEKQLTKQRQNVSDIRKIEVSRRLDRIGVVHVLFPVHGKYQLNVDLGKKTCDCYYPHNRGLPCIHMWCFAMHLKIHDPMENFLLEFCDGCSMTDYWQVIKDVGIVLVSKLTTLERNPFVHPPHTVKKRGPRSKFSRLEEGGIECRRSSNRVCKKCLQPGHNWNNKSKCKKYDPNEHKSRKKRTTRESTENVSN